MKKCSLLQLVSACFYHIPVLFTICLFLEQFTTNVCCHIVVAEYVLKTKILNTLEPLYIKLIKIKQMSKHGTVNQFS